jgi:F0F1-type ATP synthase delta subunit
VEAVKISNMVISPSDVVKLRREINALDDFFVAAKARQTGTTMQLPKLTRVLNETAKDNNVNLLEPSERRRLSHSLENIYEKAPVLHISFASEPSPKALEKLMVWVRSNIHPQALIRVGLQPSIAAGCYIRTPNKGFDLSLRAALNRSKPELQKLIAGAVNGR